MRNKVLLFAMLLLLPMLAFAQNAKRVAILETVDKFDKVEYGVEFQLRAFITDAVNKTPGYEGFDRVDMSQINKEHNFQRTGMVSDADIKKLGVMTGASSVVVAEAADYGFGDGRIIIAAKIINIESGRIENSTRPKVASPDGNGMETACKEVVAELLGNSESSLNIRTGKDKQTKVVDNNALEHIMVNWDITSRPQGADVEWRVISHTPEVSNENYKYLGTTPYECIDTFEIKGLTYNNCDKVQIELRVSMEGYDSQTKVFDVPSLIDENDVSIMFRLFPQ